MMCQRPCEDTSLTREQGNGHLRFVLEKARWKECNETTESLEAHSTEFEQY